MTEGNIGLYSPLLGVGRLNSPTAPAGLIGLVPELRLRRRNISCS